MPGKMSDFQTDCSSVSNSHANQDDHATSTITRFHPARTMVGLITTGLPQTSIRRFLYPLTHAQAGDRHDGVEKPTLGRAIPGSVVRRPGYPSRRKVRSRSDDQDHTFQGALP
jgi:hypothetical protein